MVLEEPEQFCKTTESIKATSEQVSFTRAQIDSWCNSRMVELRVFCIAACKNQKCDYYKFLIKKLTYSEVKAVMDTSMGLIKEESNAEIVSFIEQCGFKSVVGQKLVDNISFNSLKTLLLTGKSPDNFQSYEHVHSIEGLMFESKLGILLASSHWHEMVKRLGIERMI